MTHIYGGREKVPSLWDNKTNVVSMGFTEKAKLNIVNQIGFYNPVALSKLRAIKPHSVSGLTINPSTK